MNEIYEADYVVGLIKNEVTDSIRNDYLSFVIEAEDKPAGNVFYLILSTIIGTLGEHDYYTKETAKERIATEFNALNLGDKLGKYEIYKPFVDMLIDLHSAAIPSKEKLDSYKALIEAANLLPEDYKNQTYYAVLASLVRSRSLARDLSFTEMVMEYVKTIVFEDANNLPITSLVSFILSSIVNEERA